jgi:hypothetical protein
MRGEEIVLGVSIPSDGLLNDGQLFAHAVQSNSSARIQLPCGA